MTSIAAVASPTVAIATAAAPPDAGAVVPQEQLQHHRKADAEQDFQGVFANGREKSDHKVHTPRYSRKRAAR